MSEIRALRPDDNRDGASLNPDSLTEYGRRYIKAVDIDKARASLCAS